MESEAGEAFTGEVVDEQPRRRTRYARNAAGEFIYDPGAPGKRLKANDPRAAALGNVIDPYGATEAPKKSRKAREESGEAVATESQSIAADRLRIVQLAPQWRAVLGGLEPVLEVTFAELGIPNEPITAFVTTPRLESGRIVEVGIAPVELPLSKAIIAANAELLALYGPTLAIGAYDAALITNVLAIAAIAKALFRKESNRETVK